MLWYRSRNTFARRWSGYLGLMLLIGLIGGVAMGSIAAARRTQSSYPAFLAGTNASDLTMSTYGITQLRCKQLLAKIDTRDRSSS